VIPPKGLLAAKSGICRRRPLGISGCPASNPGGIGCGGPPQISCRRGDLSLSAILSDMMSSLPPPDVDEISYFARGLGEKGFKRFDEAFHGTGIDVDLVSSDVCGYEGESGRTAGSVCRYAV
jgi:hypothetical protein